MERVEEGRCGGMGRISNQCEVKREMAEGLGGNKRRVSGEDSKQVLLLDLALGMLQLRSVRVNPNPK